MAFLNIPNVVIRGISGCVPKHIDENNDYPINEEDKAKLISSIGVERKRIADDKTCSSDLCFKAADKLIQELNWDKSEIDCLIFVSQTPDYILPANSCILQQRLGLSTECYAQDISLGCSGWIYGMSAISSLILAGNGSLRKALLLVGDTISKILSAEDKSTWPLFGDAGTATALEYSAGSEGFKFHLATDGEGADTIIVKDGGCRNTTTPDSFVVKQFEDGIRRNDMQLYLNGINVFSFAISKGPQSINKLLENFNIDKNSVDYFTFHQANLFLNEKIRKKLKLEPEKVPYSLKNFGNTSCATIPLTMVTELREKLKSKKLNHIGCAFGVGLSWGSIYFTTGQIVCPELIEC
jgi:3-oxoacyl-[acyl-carrier-protein] synthase-3